MAGKKESISKYFLSAERIKQSQDDIEKLYDHAKVANEEMGAVKITLEAVKTDLMWLKKGFWWIVGGSLTAAITSIANLIR